jgi:hypothetical protein
MADDETSKHQQQGKTDTDNAPAAALPEQDYPPVGELPMDPYMSACETICFLSGYRRAIPKDRYLAPLGRTPGWDHPDNDAEVSVLLHNAVPDPKPAEDPIPEAEQSVMKLWRAGLLHPIDKETRQELPREISEYAIVVAVDGRIRPDGRATPQNYQRTLNWWASYKSGEIVFRKSEVQKCAEHGPECAAVPKQPPESPAVDTLRPPTEDDSDACIREQPSSNDIVTRARAEADDEALSNLRRRAALYFAAWAADGFPGTRTAKEANLRAGKHYPNHPMLSDDRRRQQEAWREAEKRPRS